MITEDELPRDLADLVNAELASGERIDWLGQPIASRFARSGLPAVLFGVPWTAFALFWMAAASGFRLPDFTNWHGLFPLFGVPFVLIGLAMLATPLWMFRKAQRTAYVLTDRRVILFEGNLWSGISVRSFEPDRLADLRRTQFPDGSGNLIFESRPGSAGESDKAPTEIGFVAIPEVKDVEDRIRTLVGRFRLPGTS